jgi:hypothetical protein
MCLYITATLPQNAKLGCVAPIFDSHKLSFVIVSNSSVLEQLPSGDVYISTTTSHCDCGSALGSLSRLSRDEPENYEHEIKKMKRKGWSEAKIRRWLEQKEQTKEKHTREDERLAKSNTPLARDWAEFISDVLGSKCTGSIGILLHFYHTDVENERIKILGKEKVKLDELTPRRLMEMKEDLVYEFVP